MPPLPSDRSNSLPNRGSLLLEQAQALLATQAEERSPFAALESLARTAGGTGAGLAKCGLWSPVFSFPRRDESAQGNWLREPSLLARLSEQRGPMRLPAGGMAALAPSLAGPPWLAWLESEQEYTDDELAAFGVVALALGRAAETDRSWADQATRAAQQHSLEASADLTRRLAHDFGNILCGILGFTELALGQQIPTSAPLHSYLNEIYRAAQAGSQFTQQLQAFSRRQTSASRPSQVSTALATLEPRLQAIRDAGSHVHLDVPAGLPTVALDPDGLQQVLGAVLDNAREALPIPGAVSLSARVVDLDEAACQSLLGSVRPGSHVELTVADTGTGLSPDAQRRLFTEPFFSTKTRRKGFGLSVSYGILHAHKAGLRLYPGAERGAVARIVMPVATASPPTPLPSLRPMAPRPKGDRVLVIDDELPVLNFVATTLDQAGYRVEPFSEGSLALESYIASLGSDPYALVLTDVSMPGMDGVELARRLMRRDPSARVLFMSGRVPPELMKQDFAGRSCQLLDKPFRIEHLLEAVRSALARPAARRATAPALHTAKK